MNHRVAILIAIACAAALSAGRVRAETTFSPAMQKLLDAKDDRRCRHIGAVPRTPAYVTCRLQLMQSREQNLVRPAPVAVQQQFQPQAYDPPPPRLRWTPLPPPPHIRIPQATNCRSDIIGNSVYTNCQ